MGTDRGYPSSIPAMPLRAAPFKCFGTSSPPAPSPPSPPLRPRNLEPQRRDRIGARAPAMGLHPPIPTDSTQLERLRKLAEDHITDFTTHEPCCMWMVD